MQNNLPNTMKDKLAKLTWNILLLALSIFLAAFISILQCADKIFSLDYD